MNIKSSLSNNLVDFSRKSKILEKKEEFFHIEEWRIKRNEKSLQVILNSYLRLAVSYAKKYKSYGLPLDDLIHDRGIQVHLTGYQFNDFSENNFGDNIHIYNTLKDLTAHI